MDSPEVKRNSNEFSFFDTAADIASNGDFRQGYVELLNGHHTDESYIWEVLSAVGNEVGEVLYENVLNYIDNVANINTCKLRALKSISEVLGTEHFELLGNLRAIPVDINNALDIFSIHPQYLVNREFASNGLVKAIKNYTVDYVEYLKKSQEISNDIQVDPDKDGYMLSDNFYLVPEINYDKYREFVEKTFYNIISSHIFATYADGQEYIFENFGKEELLSGEAIDSKILEYKDENKQRYAGREGSGYASATLSYADKIQAIKAAYRIPSSFNEQKILDDIEFGSDVLDNYQGGELSVLKLMLDIRDKQKFDREREHYEEDDFKSKLTRFSYYKEKDFFDYYKFLQTFYAQMEQKKYGINHIKRYDVDKNYMDLSGFYDEFNHVADETLYKEISAFTHKKEGEEVELPLIEAAAHDLADIALTIVEMREQLKLHAQKNYMRGTKLLLEYVVAEYVKNNLAKKFPPLSGLLHGEKLSVDEETGEEIHAPTISAIAIEYDDGTEYFNISSHNTIKAYNRNSTNPKYWNDLDAVDISLNGEQLEPEDISAFYNENLKVGLGNNVKDFLCTVYEIGNQASYFSKDEDGTLHLQLDKENLSSSYLSAGTVLSGDLEDVLSTEKEIFLLYHGSKVGYNPWFNYKNITHSSFQAHPFIYKFIEHVQKNFSVLNAFQGEAPVYLMRKLASADISAYLDRMGTLSNLWQIEGSIYDYSGWQSRYEYEEHSRKKFNGKLSPVTDYDGTFYPPAVDEFVDAISADYRDAYNAAKEGLEEGEEPTEEAIAALRTNARYNAILSSIANKKSLDENGNETFFGKYYSHLNLTEDDGIFIARQLSTFTEDILEITSPKSDPAKIYDIYKYGLDKYNNSFILYKQYKNGKNATAEEKKNTLGTLWFRLEHHPIGFPAFSYEASNSELDNAKNNRYICSPINLSNRPQIFDSADLFYKKDEEGHITTEVDTEKLNIEKASIKKANLGFLKHIVDMGRNGRVFLDMEFTPNTEYLLLVSPKNIDEWNEEESNKDVLVFPNKVYELEQLAFLEEKKKTTPEGREYTVTVSRGVFSFLNYDYLTDKWTALDLAGTFKGFAKNKSELYMFSTNAVLDGEQVTGIEVNMGTFPPRSSIGATYSTTSKIVRFRNIQNKENGSIDSMQIGMWTKMLPEDEKNIQLAYNDEVLFITFPSYYDESKDYNVRTFVGAHSLNNLSAGDEDDRYGRNSYVDGTVLQDSQEHNSFDRFTSYLTVVDVPISYFTSYYGGSTPTFKNYALNSDSSWIPSYPGLDGYTQTWTVEQYRKSIHQSAELLGHSFNKLPELIRDRKKLIGVDEDGNQTINNLNSLLSTSLRVYEDFQISDYVDYEVNDPIKEYETDEDGNEYYEWTVELLSSVNEDNIGDYQIMLYNLKSGSYDSIINCYLSDLTEDFSDDDVSYCPNNSIYETRLLDGLLPEEHLRVVGTMNVFGDGKDIDSESITNHLINIKGIKAKIVKDESGRYSIVLRLYRDRTHGTREDGSETDYSNFYIHRKTLGLFAFKESLSEYEKYHYMSPFTLWPYAPTMISGTSEEDYGSFPWPDLSAQTRKEKLWNGTHPYDSVYNDPAKIETSWTETMTDSAISAGYINLYNNLSSSYPISHSKLENIDLTNYNSLSSIYELRSGMITWKISEEDKFDVLKDLYPPKLIDSMLYDLFDMNNVNKSGDSVFSLSNTFIFQLENAEEMCDLISEVAVPIYTITDDCLIAWEDYLSDSYYVDSEGVELVPYIEHYDPTQPNVRNVLASISGGGDYGSLDEFERLINEAYSVIGQAYVTEVSTWLSDINLEDYKYQEDLWEFLSADNIQIYPAYCDRTDEKSMADVKYFTLTPEQIEDYLKLYVSYSMYDAKSDDENDKQQIELHFNMQNLFCPLFRKSTVGKSYHTEVKQGTYLSLKSHETGYLQVVLQLQYIDGAGNIAGVRDLPILTYKIANMSDDKPKFVASRIWRIDNRDGNLNTLSGMSNAFLIVDTVNYRAEEISSFIGSNYQMEEDFPATTRMYTFSDMPITSLSGTLYYETGKGFSESQDTNTFVHEDGWSKPGEYHTDDAFVDFAINGEVAQADLEFTLKEGMLIPEDEPELFFPVDVLSVTAIDSKGNTPRLIIINGGIEFNFDLGNTVIAGRYLGREANPNGMAGTVRPEDKREIKIGDALNSAKFGWVLEEQDRALIRIYNAKHESTSISSDTDDITLLINVPKYDETGHQIGYDWKDLVSTAGGGGTRALVRKNPTILFQYDDSESGEYVDDFHGGGGE